MIGQKDCPFCARIEAGEYDGSWLGGVHFEPLNPVTPGHRLFVTREHEGPLESPFSYEPEARSVRTSRGMRANKARGLYSVFPLFYAWREQENLTEEFNLILNAGANASQSIEHLHLHYVPRRPGDGLVLPWTNQQPLSIEEWSVAMDIERELQIAHGYDDTHDVQSGPPHLLNWAIDYARRGRPLAAATMVRSALRLLEKTDGE